MHAWFKVASVTNGYTVSLSTDDGEDFAEFWFRKMWDAIHFKNWYNKNH
jgi:hypothetical protein